MIDHPLLVFGVICVGMGVCALIFIQANAVFGSTYGPAVGISVVGYIFIGCWYFLVKRNGK
jgi:hypothetical protein